MIIILLIVLATFIYNEIIIIKICNLDKNVAKKIASRAILELDQIKILEEDDDDEHIREESLELEEENTKIELRRKTN